MNELTKFFLGVASVLIASYSKILILLPILFVFYSIYLLRNTEVNSKLGSFKFFSLLLAMSIIDRYDISYGIINIFYLTLLFFLIYQFYLIYIENKSINLFWLYFTLISIMLILLISARSVINIEDVFKWALLLSMPVLILLINYKINFERFFLYIKDINIFLIGIGLGQLLAIGGFIPFSNASGLDMEYHAVRPTGLSSEPTWYSQQLAILLGINILSGIKLSRIFYIISLISLFIIFICFTRGAYLILFVLMSLVLIKNLNFTFHRPIASLCLVSFISLSLYLVLPQIVNTDIILNIVQKFLFQDASAGARFEGIISTFNYWLEKPILGHGFAYDELMVTSEGTATNQKIFNSFLGSLATGGLLLFCLYVFILLYLFLNSLEIYLLNNNYLPLFIVSSYFLLSAVMPFAYSFFGIFVTMFLSVLTLKNNSIKHEM